MSPELRQALRVVAEAMAPGSAVPVPRETLLELLAAPAESDHLTVVQAAAILGRSQGTVRLWCAQGEIPGAVRWRGREWRIPRRGLEEFQQSDGKPRTDNPGPGTPADLGSWRAHLKAS
jgi:excisionase family DNA binding protein